MESGGGFVEVRGYGMVCGWSGGCEFQFGVVGGVEGGTGECDGASVVG